MTAASETGALDDWVFGIHGVRALLAEAPNDIRRVVVAEGRRSRAVEALVDAVRDAGLRVERRPRQALSRMAQSGSHQGIAAERSAFLPATERDLEERLPGWRDPLLVVLDGIEDPRNLGACLRTAAAAGADAVLVPRRGSAPLSSTVAKTASGALEHVFIVEVANLARRLQWLREQGIWLVGGVSDADAPPHSEVDYRGAAAIAVGSEGSGLKRLTRERCDHLVSIPLAGAMASLNVSVALGVLLFEARRQRLAAVG